MIDALLFVAVLGALAIAFAVDVAALVGWLKSHGDEREKAMTIHDDDERKAQQAFDDHFGTCPRCHKSDGYINVSSTHFFVCHEHKLKWCVGSNLFSSWREQTEQEQRAIYDRFGIGGYREIDLDECHRPGDPYDSEGGPVYGPGVIT